MTITQLTGTPLIYIAAAALFCIGLGVAVATLWSNARIAKLETVISIEKMRADNLAKSANEKESEAREFRAKTEYLERSIGEIRSIAEKQDEELEQIHINTNTRRDAVARARRVRSIDTTADELCTKLAEIGYPCGK